jgi:hypothetical protein
MLIEVTKMDCEISSSETPSEFLIIKCAKRENCK